jgi:branched-chain amino acid transport system substrate-binding protein
VAPLSGPAALLGQDQLDGFMLAVEQLSGKLGGEAANVLKEDEQAAGNR